MKRQIIIVLSVIIVVFGIIFMTTKTRNTIDTDTKYDKNTVDTTKIDTETENTVDLAKINAFIKAPTLANYNKLNRTEKKNSDVIFAVKDFAKPILINAFNYTQTMYFEPISRFKIKNNSLVAFIDSVKQLYCVNKNITLNLKIKKPKPLKNNIKLFHDIETNMTLSIHDIYRKLLAYQEILANYHKIANFKIGMNANNLTPNAIDSIKKYRILLLNYRGVYKKRDPSAFKNPYGLITIQLNWLFNLGSDLLQLKFVKVAPTFYNKNGKETQKGIIWGRIDSIIDNSCKN